MNNILVLIAVMFFVAAIIVGTFTENTAKNLLITWGLLAIGGTLFGIGITL